MDLNKLSIKFLTGFQSNVYHDGETQKDKILPFMTIVYPYRGYYEVCLGDDPLSCLPHGAGCYITAPGARQTIVHRLSAGEDFMSPRWIKFSVMYDGILDVTDWFAPPLLVTGPQAEPFIRSADELLEIKQLPNHVQNFRKLRIAGQLLEALLAICPCNPVSLELERIYPAILLVKDRFAQTITVQQLADACAMSPATFYRLFRQIVNKTPMQYLEDYRLTQAAQLLLSDTDTLAVIAEKCGYWDEFHLSRNFKKHYGISPREYKKQAIL